MKPTVSVRPGGCVVVITGNDGVGLLQFCMPCVMIVFGRVCVCVRKCVRTILRDGCTLQIITKARQCVSPVFAVCVRIMQQRGVNGATRSHVQAQNLGIKTPENE